MIPRKQNAQQAANGNQDKMLSESFEWKNCA